MSTQTDVSVEQLFDLTRDTLNRPEVPPACDTRLPECSREAVFIIRWRADGRCDVSDRCSCARVTHQCLEHGESYMGLSDKGLMIACTRCTGFMVPVNVDRIRRG